MSNPLEQQPTFDQQVSHFKDAIQHHQNITCEFNSLPRDEQVKMARALSTGNLPDVSFKFGAAESSVLTATMTQKNADGVCKASEAKKPVNANPNAYDAEELANARAWNGIAKEQRPRLDAEAAAEYKRAHDPAMLAKNIEDAAARDLKAVPGAKLEVRVRIEELMTKETPEVRQQVLERLQHDGSKWDPRNPVPKAEIHYSNDGSGEGEIVFSSGFGERNSDAVSLTKSVVQQAREAEQQHLQGMTNVSSTGGSELVLHEVLKGQGTLSQKEKYWFEQVAH